MRKIQNRRLELQSSGIPDADNLRTFAGNLDLGFAHQTADVCDWSHGGSHEPRQTHRRADGNQECEDKQVQMVTVTLLQDTTSQQGRHVSNFELWIPRAFVEVLTRRPDCPDCSTLISAVLFNYLLLNFNAIWSKDGAAIGHNEALDTIKTVNESDPELYEFTVLRIRFQS